jgi:hypothetical protein
MNNLKHWSDEHKIFRGLPNSNKAFMITFDKLVPNMQRTKVKDNTTKRINGLLLPSIEKCKEYFNSYVGTSMFELT